MAGEGTPIIDQDELWKRDDDGVTLSALATAEGLDAYDQFTGSVLPDGSIESVIDSLNGGGQPPVPEAFTESFLDSSELE